MTAIDFAAFVDQLAGAAGETILPFFRTALSVSDKGGPGAFDPVTAADHAAETVMRGLIRRQFPDHGIVGEEYGAERAEAEYVWFLDPIDGFKSVFARSLGLLQQGVNEFREHMQPQEDEDEDESDRGLGGLGDLE